MWLLFWWCCGWMASEEPALFVLQGQAQGTTYSIRYMSRDSLVSAASIDSIFRAVDASLSLYQEGSLISVFNRQGTVRMDEHMTNVVTAALRVYEESGGAFDITTRTLSLLWRPHRLGQGPPPSAKDLRQARRVTGSRYLGREGDRLTALRPGVKIDCNGIAQGYTVDLLYAFLRSRGIQRLVVELGGEVRACGKGPGGRDWRVGVESLSGAGEVTYTINMVIGLNEKSVTTSGNYRQPGHIIDPMRGRPVQNNMVSVTVVAEDAMTADAWDNAFFVMGRKKAMQKVRGMPGIDLHLLYRDASGVYRDTSTAGFTKMIQR